MINDTQDYSDYKTPKVIKTTFSRDAESYNRWCARKASKDDSFLFFGSECIFVELLLGEHPSTLNIDDAQNMGNNIEDIGSLAEKMSSAEKDNYYSYVERSRKRAEDNYKWNHAFDD